jgi:hemolysin activation/secretion protein
LTPRADVLHPSTPVTVLTPLPDESPCFVITNIDFTGKDAWRFRWLQDTAQAFVHRCVGVQGLSQIASILDAKLIELGYATTRVSLPQQNLRAGTLTLVLNVGRVSEINMVSASDHAPDKNWGTWWNAFPVGRGDILNIRDLEQGVEQMKRLPSQSVTTRIEPGQEPDTSNIVIERQPMTLGDRVRGGVTLDNSGFQALGHTQLSAYVALDNLLGLNDVFNFSGNINAEQPDPGHRSLGVSASYSIPWGYNTFSISKSKSRFAQVVQGTTVQFLSSGRSESTEAKWHYLLLRTESSKAGIYAALSTRRAVSYLDDVELIVQRRRTTNIETGLTFKRLLGAGSMEFELGYRRGMPWQDAQDDLPEAGSGGLTLRPRITVLSATLNQPLTLGGRGWQYGATLRAQHTRDATLSVDQFAIGNRSNVRGFDAEGVLLAESGYFLRNEWSTPTKLIDIDTLAFVGIDLGRVWGPSTANLVGNKLAGAAFGARGKWQSLQFDLTLATPLYKPEGFRSRRWNPYLSLTYAF